MSGARAINDKDGNYEARERIHGHAVDGDDVRPQRPNVLVVDDDATNRRLLEAILKPEGYSIQCAPDARAALGIVACGKIDLVLLDVMMPGIDGVDACRMIREDLGMRFLPIVLVTALSDRRARTRGKEAGADDFISKPIFEDELLARVRTLLKVKSFQDALNKQYEATLHEARRWRLVSRVAERVASAASLDQIAVRLCDALADDLPIAHPTFFFEGDDADEVPDTLPANGLVIPLSSAGGTDGVLIVEPVAQLPHGFDESEIELLMSLAPHIANSIARVRLHETRAALDQAKERMTALLVHDLKSPLAVVQMNLELARMTANEPTDDAAASREEMRAPLDDAATATEQLAHMLLDLLDIGRAEDGKLPFVPTAVDLLHIIHETTARLQPVVERRGARLVTHIDDELVVRCDPALIVRVLQNLLTNAGRFAPEGGTIEICAFPRSDEGRETIIIEVSNDGPSIPADAQPHLFAKYGQVHGNQEHNNRGLGLYLCRLVAERHGGTMSVRDRAAGGVTFSLTLPR